MGFGLHVGWAIEGAIGSEYKIDASYLSPNVNMASRLEAATKQFGVPLLLSEAFHDILSPKTKRRTRQIDAVSVKGEPVNLHLCILETICFAPSRDEVSMAPVKTVPMHGPVKLRLDQHQVSSFSIDTP
jgi:hypothetical protein